MKIAILGTGTVGQHLARGYIAKGHSVVFGSRSPDGENAVSAVAAAPGSQAATFATAAASADWIVLATPWSATADIIAAATPSNFIGKLVVDATNPIDYSSGKPKLALGFTTSAGEHVQHWLPGAHVVKAFNTVGAARMIEPHYSEGRPTMFIAGNDADAKATVTKMLEQFGWEAIDAGAIDAARLLEPQAMLWIHYGLSSNTWNHAFKLLRI